MDGTNLAQMTVFSNVFSDAPNPSNTVDDAGVQGRGVRVQLNGTEALSLAEVQDMGYTQ